LVTEKRFNIGILNVQGAVSEHVNSVRKLGDNPVLVKHPDDIEMIDGLIIPGGESTTIGKLIEKYQLSSLIKEKAKQGMPIFGTCAGLILLADQIEGFESAHLRLMDITVNRNSFGRQRESFETPIHIKGIAEDFPAVFIRAPHIVTCGAKVEVLSEFEGKIVAAQQGNLLVTAFHPELTEDTSIHLHFRNIIKRCIGSIDIANL
jgi:5'-phosphate synthase pdxT subunit